MRTTLSNLLGPRPTPPLPTPAPPTPTDPALMAMLEDIRRRIVRIETRQARWMTRCNVDLGNKVRDIARMFHDHQSLRERIAIELVPVLAMRPAAVPMTERELELIDGMIAVQLDHAQRCDAISNRDMAEKQKGWDMERVELLRRIRYFGITAHAQKGTNGEIS